MRHQLATVVALAGMALWPAAVAAQEATTTTTEQQQLSEADRNFAQEATVANMAEVELGQMAVDKASNEQVSEYGQRMIDDHGMAQDQLEQIAQDKDIQLSTEMPEDKQQMRDQLQDLSEAEFDRAYIDHMVTDHEQAIELFQNQADNGQDQELQQYAEQTLPTLQEHLDQAKQIQTEISEMAGAMEESPEATEPAAGAATGTAADEPTTTQQAAAPGSAFGQMTADELIGSQVVNQNGEEVGELTDIVINQQDKAVNGIISVGGFLGVGEKDVAIPFDQLQPGENETVLMSTMTEEELESMPAYDEQQGGYDPFPRDRTLGENQ